MTDKLLHNSKRIIKNTLALYFRMVMLMLVTLYMSRVVLNALGVEDYGIYNVVGGIVTMLTFLVSSLSNVTQRYLNISIAKGDFIEVKHVFNQCLCVFILLALLLIAVMLPLGEYFVLHKMNIPENRIFAACCVFRCSIITFFLLMVQMPFMGMVIAQEKMTIYAYIGLLEAFGRLGVAFLLSFLQCIDLLIVYACLMVTISFLVTLFYILYCRAKFSACRFDFYWNKQLFKDMFIFVGQSAVGGLAWICRIQGTNIILNLFFGPAINAARSIATQVTVAIYNFTDGIITAIKPQIVKSYAVNDLGYMQALICMGSKYSFFVLMVIGIPIFLETEYVLKLWLKLVPDYTVVFVRLALIDAVFSVLLPPLWNAANATGKIKRVQVNGRICILLAFPLSYLLLNFVANPLIPIWALLVAQMCYWLYCLVDIHKQIGLKYITYISTVLKPIAIILFIVVAVVGCIHVMVDSPGYRFVSVVCSTILLSLCLIYWVGMTAIERSYAQKIVMKYFKRKM